MTIIKPNLETLMSMIDHGDAKSITELYKEFRFYTEPLKWNEEKSNKIMTVRYFPEYFPEIEGRDYIIFDDINTVNERLIKYNAGKLGPHYMWTSTIEPYLQMYNVRYDELLSQIQNLNSPIIPILMKNG